jgi:hypothetical protein
MPLIPALEQAAEQEGQVEDADEQGDNDEAVDHGLGPSGGWRFFSCVASSYGTTLAWEQWLAPRTGCTATDACSWLLRGRDRSNERVEVLLLASLEGEPEPIALHPALMLKFETGDAAVSPWHQGR